MKTQIAIISLLVGLSLSDASVAADDFNSFLKKYDEIVKVYEGYGTKQPFCMTHINEINGNILVKITELSAAGNKLQADKNNPPTAAQMAKYVEITNRYQKAMLQMSKLMNKIDMGC